MKNQIVFMGTPDFGAVILKGLIENDIKPVLVITEKDMPKGRNNIITPPPVKVLAEEYNIPVIQELKDIKADLGITASFGKILKKDFLNSFKYGCINVHPSLLPKYRGATPIQTAILNGEKETGVSLIKMDEELDHGAIIDQEIIIIEKEDDNKTLQEKTAKIAIEMLVKNIPLFLKQKSKLVVQNHSLATYTKILQKQDGKIDWNKDAIEIERQIRAYYPWPGSFTFLNKNDKKVMLKILKGLILDKQINDFKPGQVFISSENQLCVKCKDTSLIIEELQLEGKKILKAEDFLRGNKDFVGSILL